MSAVYKHGLVQSSLLCYNGGRNVPASRKVALTACFSGLLKIGAQVISSFAPQSAPLSKNLLGGGSVLCDDRGVNVPAIRTVAERPASITWRSRVWPLASSKPGSQVICWRVQTKLHLQFGSIEGYNTNTSLWPTDCVMPIVRNSPSECANTLTDCRATGLALRVLTTSLQVCQLASVVANRHRVGHDPKQIVHDTQKVVGYYHLFLLRACCFLSRCSPRRDSFARHQARYAPRKPASQSFPPLGSNRQPRHAFCRQIHATIAESNRDKPTPHYVSNQSG
jgi:hypothetical protein